MNRYELIVYLKPDHDADDIADLEHVACKRADDWSTPDSDPAYHFVCFHFPTKSECLELESHVQGFECVQSTDITEIEDENDE